MALSVYLPLCGAHQAVPSSLSVTICDGRAGELICSVSLPCQARLRPGVRCFFLAVYYLSLYNIHSWMLERWGPITDCTNIQRQTANRSLGGFSSVLPPSPFPAPCNYPDLVHTSWLQVNAVWSPLREKRDESQDTSLKQHSTRIWQTVEGIKVFKAPQRTCLSPKRY